MKLIFGVVDIFEKKLRLYPSFCLTFPNAENFSSCSETIGLVPSEHIFVEFQFIQEWGNLCQKLFMSRAHNPYSIVLFLNRDF